MLDEEKEPDKISIFSQKSQKIEKELEINAGCFNAQQEIIDQELKSMKTDFNIDILKWADIIFDLYIQMNPSKKEKPLLTIEEILVILDVIGFKKKKVDVEKTFYLLRKNDQVVSKVELYSKENFIQLVRHLKDYRIEDKFLVEAFRTIDKEGDGLINFEKIRRISTEKRLNFSNEEISDMLQFFEIEDSLKNLTLYGKSTNETGEHKALDFAQFCELYYQG